MEGRVDGALQGDQIALLSGRFGLGAKTVRARPFLMGSVPGRLKAGCAADGQQFFYRIEGDGEIHISIMRTDVRFFKMMLKALKGCGMMRSSILSVIEADACRLSGRELCNAPEFFSPAANQTDWPNR